MCAEIVIQSRNLFFSFDRNVAFNLIGNGVLEVVCIRVHGMKVDLIF
jgi:hypothetical protein